MASENNITLTPDWQELSSGTAIITLVSGGSFWLNVGDSAPADDLAYFEVTPEEKYFSYPGTKKIFGKLPVDGVSQTIVSPTEVS